MYSNTTYPRSAGSRSEVFPTPMRINKFKIIEKTCFAYFCILHIPFKQHVHIMFFCIYPTFDSADCSFEWCKETSWLMSDQSASGIWMTCFSWSNSRQHENDGWRQWEIYRQTETLRGKCLQQHLTQFLQNLQHIKSHFCLHCIINFEMRCFVLIIFEIFWTVFFVNYLLFPLPFLRLFEIDYLL